MGTVQLEDFPPGPLDAYRKLASFCWKKLKFYIEDEKSYEVKVKLWNDFKKDPIFLLDDTGISTEEMKRRTAVRLRQYFKNILPKDIHQLGYKEKTRHFMTMNEALNVCFQDVAVKFGIGVSLIQNSFLSLGTDRHVKMIQSFHDNKVVASFSLTEVAHGSNTKKMRTMATFDIATQEFVINTPDFEAAKCWIGNIGKQATVTMLFAQLYTQGQCHGLHAFIVPLRDHRTLEPFPGVIIANIEEKIGVHGVDNGVLMFKNYRIPRENLLNRTADVTPEGDYVSSFTEPGKILGAALENLSTGRVAIAQESTVALIQAVTIAVRYAAVRKQFGPTEQEEVSIIEYPLHQWRVFPYVAAATVFKISLNRFVDDYLNTVLEANKLNGSTRVDSMGDKVAEIHGFVSALKPLFTKTNMDAIQECREACGGHGFLKSAQLGDLRNNCDPKVTYEGDNNVLVQQTSNWLLRQWHKAINSKNIASPLGTASYLNNYREVSSKTFKGTNIHDVMTYKFLQDSYEWVIVFLCNATYNKQEYLVSKGCSKFDVRNHTQVYKATVLAKVYAEYQILRYYWMVISDADPSFQSTLENLGLLYGLWSLEKHYAYFYEGCYANNVMVTLVKDAILELCSRLKPEVVSVIDALAPPDFVLKSTLGRSDGKVYKALENEFFGKSKENTRPDWWKEMSANYTPIKVSKL